MTARPDRPLLSVIVPAHNGAAVLRRSLPALRGSHLPAEAWELIVVDDASTDDTEFVAARFADTVIRLAGNPHGPAYARNRGAEASRGAVLVFVDADVVLHVDALERIARHFLAPDAPAALFGSYDLNPYHGSIVSQYRNLLHHYVHSRSPGRAETFWSGLGAIRANVFRDVGLFDEWHYSQPQIEDVELGRRLRRAGHEVLLDPAIQGTHLKEWTLRSMLVTDFRHRGIPWMWLLLREGRSAASRTLNVGTLERVSTFLFGIGMLALAGALLTGERWMLGLAIGAPAFIALLNLPFYLYLRHHRSLLFALGILPLHLAYFGVNILAVGGGWIINQLLGAPAPPAERQALAQVGLVSWPPPIRRPRSSLWIDEVAKPAAGEGSGPAHPGRAAP